MGNTNEKGKTGQILRKTKTWLKMTGRKIIIFTYVVYPKYILQRVTKTDTTGNYHHYRKAAYDLRIGVKTDFLALTHSRLTVRKSHCLVLEYHWVILLIECHHVSTWGHSMDVTLARRADECKPVWSSEWPSEEVKWRESESEWGNVLRGVQIRLPLASSPTHQPTHQHPHLFLPFLQPHLQHFFRHSPHCKLVLYSSPTHYHTKVWDSKVVFQCL